MVRNGALTSRAVEGRSSPSRWRSWSPWSNCVASKTPESLFLRLQQKDLRRTLFVPRFRVCRQVNGRGTAVRKPLISFYAASKIKGLTRLGGPLYVVRTLLSPSRADRGSAGTDNACSAGVPCIHSPDSWCLGLWSAPPARPAVSFRGHGIRPGLGFENRQWTWYGAVLFLPPDVLGQKRPRCRCGERREARISAD